MSKRIEKLTPEQEARFSEFVERWTKIGLSVEPADRPRAEAAIRKMYDIAGIAQPEKIVWCGSPLSQALTREVVKRGGADLGKKVRASVWDSVRDSVRASVWDSVRSSVGASVGASVWDSVRSSVGASVRDSVGASVRDSVWDSVGASVGASVWDSVRSSVGASVRDSVGASVYGQHDANWLGFYDFFRDACALTTETDRLQGLFELAKSAGWALPHENICWISERHNILSRDEEGRLHSETGPSVSYPDGWSLYHWHGTAIPSEWIEDRKSLTAAVALKQANVERRRAACEILGWAKILSELDAKTLDHDADPQIGDLVQVNLPDLREPAKFLRVQCGTGREFAIGIPPHINKALDAQAWIVGLEAKDFTLPEVRA